MQVVHEYRVIPSVPEPLAPLKELAYNLHWSWDPELFEVFRSIDHDLWEETGHNPALVLGSVSQVRLEELASDEAYLAYLDRVYQQHREHMDENTWYGATYGGRSSGVIAYFSAEFGLTECLPLYSGGLGVLSGDHLKSSSELGIPLVGVGLLYRRGYFKQYLNADGWQQAVYPGNDFDNMPITMERRQDGSPLTVAVPHPGRGVKAQVWRAQVGRVPLYLLDTDVTGNDQDDRKITGQLYGGDREMRIRQEMVLGIGGLRALRALGIRPGVCHMNEGHSAFQVLERIRHAMEDDGIEFDHARELCAAGNVFTTHTPVPAGFDLFSPDLMHKYFSEYVKALHIDMEALLRLGRTHPEDQDEFFNMAILAFRNASFVNGVSALHGQVSRKLFQASVPHVPLHEVPVVSIANGAHARSWISSEMTQLLNRYLGSRWLQDPTDESVWQRVEEIPGEELWRTHERRRERLVAMARRRLAEQLLRRGVSKATVAVAEEALDPTILTVGIARRFATYKRATLVFRDPERLRRILLHADKPVQLIVAGKAHPYDEPGKELIRQIVHIARDEELRRRIVMLENYDLALARHLVQGADVWLNTPRRPFEASGTSGMKVVFNGGLNLSVLDGWWCEGYRPEVGWAIGSGEEYRDHEYQDRVESDALYDLLEEEVVPTFYERGRDGLPRKWIGMMKTSMRELGPVFNANRMVYEYTERFYLPADERYRSMMADNAGRAKTLAEYKARVKGAWKDVRVLEVKLEREADIEVGDALAVNARVHLGTLSPDQVTVQVFDGKLDTDSKITEGTGLSLSWRRSLGKQTHEYRGSFPRRQSGRRGFTVRVLPSHEDLLHPQMMGLVCWE